MSADAESLTAEERAERAERALEEALAERAELWAELQRRRAADTELAEVRHRLALLEASPSWRLTRPLRQIKATVQRLRRLSARAWPALRAR